MSSDLRTYIYEPLILYTAPHRLASVSHGGTIRHRLPLRSGRPPLTEIIGTLNLFTDFIFGMMVFSDFLLIFAVGIIK